MKWDDIKPAEPAKSAVMKWDDIQPIEVDQSVRQVGSPLQEIGRQAGLLGRSLIKGPLDVADFVTTPLRESLNLIPGVNIPAGALQRDIPEALGLPEPESTSEKVLTKGTEMAAGAGGLMKGAQVVSGALPTYAVKTKDVLSTMAANPFLQMSSAASAGGAGEYVKEKGGSPLEQFLASLAAGVGAGAVTAVGQKAFSTGKSLLDSLRGSPQLNAQIDITIQNALKQSGINAADVPTSVINQLRADVQKSIKTGAISPDAARRLADYRIVGATPTAANLTLDPAAVSQQRNLAKIGINSQDPVLQKLGQIQNINNRVLIENLNRMGADTTDDGIAAAQKIIKAIEGKNTAAKSAIDDLYKLARGTEGRSAQLDPSAFTNRASDMLDEALLGGKLPADVRNKLNEVSTGKMPLTVDVAEQLKTAIGSLQRASADGAERKALGMVRQALDETPLLQGQGQQAINAFNKAREANRAWMSVVDKTPALQAVRDGVQPDKFVQTYIVGSGKDANLDAVTRLGILVKGNPEASIAIRDNLAQYLKSKAISGAQDEVGNFSQSAYNKAFQSIGERKLSLFFKPEEMNQLKAIGRVASYEQFQPKGSAINNSNTAGAAISTILDKLGSNPILRKVPLFSEIVGNPVKTVSTNIQAGRAMDVKNALALPKEGAGANIPVWMIPLAAENQRQR